MEHIYSRISGKKIELDEVLIPQTFNRRMCHPKWSNIVRRLYYNKLKLLTSHVGLAKYTTSLRDLTIYLCNALSKSITLQRKMSLIRSYKQAFFSKHINKFHKSSFINIQNYQNTLLKNIY